MHFALAARVNDDRAMLSRDMFVFDDDVVIGQPTDGVNAHRERVELLTVAEKERRWPAGGTG